MTPEQDDLNIPKAEALWSLSDVVSGLAISADYFSLEIH
jgi:hypothetical protein